MAVTFGGTISDYVVAPNGSLLGGGVFTLFTDEARTIPATGLTNETGAAIGNTVTARASGVFKFNAPDSTTVLYTADGSGGSVALLPRSASVIGGTGFTYDTDGCPMLTDSSGFGA